MQFLSVVKNFIKSLFLDRPKYYILNLITTPQLSPNYKVA